jgi:hypothetical protein
MLRTGSNQKMPRYYLEMGAEVIQKGDKNGVNSRRAGNG